MKEINSRIVVIAFLISCGVPHVLQAQPCAFTVDHILTTGDQEPDDAFGQSVAIYRHLAIVGAWQATINNNDTGSAYLFDVQTGEQTFKLVAEDGQHGDRFGWSVAVEGDRAAVGARNNEYGSVYIFDTITGTQVHQFIPDRHTTVAGVGQSVDISDGIVAVGADDRQVFLLDAASGQQLSEIVPDDWEFRDAFGRALAIDGGILVVGAAGDIDPERGTRGSVYIYDVAVPTEPKLLAKLHANDPEYDGYFGSAVAISGDRVVVGAPRDNYMGEQTGSAYLFDVSDPVHPRQIRTLLPNDPTRHAYFGSSVGISCESAVVCAWNANKIERFIAHSVYFYDINTGELMTSSDGGDSGFARSVSITESTVLVGVNGDYGNGARIGQAWIMSLACEPQIDIGGQCPGDLEVRWCNTSPERPASLLYGARNEAFTLPSNLVCGGTVIGVAGHIRQVATFQTGPDGSGSQSGRAGAAACGGYLQLIVRVGSGDCRTSNVSLIPSN